MPRPLLYAVGFAAVAVGALAVITTRANSSAQRTQAAGPLDAWVIEAGAGPVLVVNDRATASRQTYGRLVAVDARDGRRLATRVEHTPQIGCSPARGRLWCRLRSQLVLVDARTLADVTGVAAAIAQAGLPAAVEDQITVTEDAATAVLADGRIARLDATTLAVTEVAAPAGSSVSAVAQAGGCDLPTELDHPPLGFSAGPRRRVVVRGAAEAAPSDAAAVLLEPRFLASDGRTCAPLRAGDGVLVHHVSSLEPATAQVLLSRTDRTGALAWTRELGGVCQYATVVDGALVVATTSGARRARAVDLATGAVRWQLTFE